MVVIYPSTLKLTLYARVVEIDLLHTDRLRNNQTFDHNKKSEDSKGRICIKETIEFVSTGNFALKF